MRRNTIIFIFSVLAVLAGCASYRSGQVPADFLLTVTHSSCRGSCPGYAITVDANGNAVYEGRRNVEMMGKYSKVLPRKTMKLIAGAIREANFWDFDELYGGGVADLPSIITEVVMEGRRKRVEDIRQAPQPLKELEAKLETLIGKTDWQKQE